MRLQDEINSLEIIVDTREKKPLQFENVLIGKEQYTIRTIPRGLQTGDYTAVGLESFLAIEYKATEDLVRCVFQDRERFSKQLERLSHFRWAFVLATGSWLSILKHVAQETQGNPSSVESSLLNWMLRYPTIHWVHRTNVADAARTVVKLSYLAKRVIRNESSQLFWPTDDQAVSNSSGCGEEARSSDREVPVVPGTAEAGVCL